MNDWRTTFLDTTGQLNALGISLYVDAMRLGRVEDLPEPIYTQAQSNMATLGQILRVFNTIRHEGHSASHPFFDVYLPQQRQAFLASEVCEPIAEYDYEIAALFRSTDAAHDLAPTDPIFVKEELPLAWSAALPTVLDIQVENNEYELILEQTVNNGHSIPLPKGQFPNGLYYYKLLAVDALKVMGKFYVYRY